MKREDGLAYLMMRANQSDMSKNNKRIESSLDMASWSLINPTRFDSNFLAVLTNYDADSPYGSFPQKVLWNDVSYSISFNLKWKKKSILTHMFARVNWKYSLGFNKEVHLLSL